MVRKRVLSSEMTLGKRVREQRNARGWSQADLARRVSAILRRPVSQVAIHHIESRGNVNPRFVVELAQALGVSLSWLREGRGDMLRSNDTNNSSGENDAQIGENNRQPFRDVPENPLLLYRTVLLEPGRGGTFMMYQEPVDEVPRPFFLKFSTKAFAIKVLDDSNYPALRRWDTVIVDPAGSIAVGEDHIFTQDLSAAGGESVIGCLKQSTGTHWIVHQYGTKKDLDLPKADYPNAWPLVAKYHRR
jgi:transcriptional regulator with XRE-family HTH domain